MGRQKERIRRAGFPTVMSRVLAIDILRVRKQEKGDAANRIPWLIQFQALGPVMVALIRRTPAEEDSSF